MSDTETQGRPNDQWADNALSDNQLRNRESAALIPVSRTGVIPMNFAQMVDYAKFMSTAKGAVGAHLMGNVGACLAVMEIANQFGMPAYAVARQSYLVNNRVAFMGQFFHAIVEDYAPLKKGPNGRKLQFRYEGEGPTLKIIVSGTFNGASEPSEFESPMFKDIQIKYSPLWKSPSPSDVKRQFVYYGVRGWQTTNWPEGMLQAITEDEAHALPPSEYARDVTPLKDPAVDELRQRLAAAKEENGGEHSEGHREGFTEATFSEIANGGGAKPEASGEIADPAGGAGSVDQPKVTDPPQAKEPAAPAKKKPTAKEAKADLPKTAAEWVPWCTAWLTAETDASEMRKRWNKEQKLRNDVGVTSEERDGVFGFYQQRLTEIEGT